MDVVECTRFPNLYPENFDPENIVTVEREINDFPATQDQLYRAWASVLKAYTGEEEPVFLSNGDIVRVKPDRWTIETVKEIHSQRKLRHSDTAIFTNSSATVYSLALKLEYNPETLSGCLLSSGHVPLEQLESVKAHLRVAVTWFSQQSKGDVPLSKLSALPASILNPNPVSFPGPDLLHHLCSDHSPREQPAIDFHGADHRHATVTFEELDHHSLNLAIQIYKSIGKSTGPSAPTIAILMQQCPELYISQLAVLKTGCAFCSINLDAPEERLQFILEDVSAPVILTTSKLAERIPASCDIKIIVVDDAIGESLSSQGTYQVFPARGSDLAYVMYTSGSTGKPKGVPVSHRAVTQSLLAHEKHIPRFSRFLQFAAPTFDVSIFEIFFTFFRGSTLVVCDRSVLLNDLPGTMNQLQIDAAELTPTVAGALLQRRNSVLGLKLLLTIGEMLTRPVVEEFGGDENRDSILWAMYGPTEAAIHCTIQPAFSTSSKVGNIGRPFDSVSAFIISPADETARWSDIDVLPLGFVGELAIGGCQLADGYLNRTEQTTAAFSDHPQLGQLYRTGDRARILQNGTIECLGRTSTGQIKLRGQRIELGEIEQTATRISGCKIAVASVIAGTLVLFCCVDPDVLVDKVKIISQKWLPAFMVPGDFVLLPKFPYLASGKVDKTRLEQQYLESRDTPSNESMEDTDASSRQIYDILQKAVGHGFPANARLAAVGLDSLLTIKTASRLRLIGYDVSPMDLLRFDTIADFQELRGSIAQKGMAQKGQCESPTPEVIRTLLERDKDLRKLLPGIETVIPCTPLQIAMLAETNTNPRAYCNWIEIECRKAASQLEIKSWLRQIVAGNEILRTGFAEISSSEHQYVQIIWKTFPNDGFTEVSRFSRDFDFQNDSSLLHPIHIQLCFDGRHHRILIQLHHALYDGWSVDLILKDLNTLATKSELQSRPQFRKVEKYYRNISNERSKEFWEDQLGSYAPAPLPQLISDHRDDDSVSSSTFKFSLSLGEVKSGCRALEISPQSVFQAALTYIISAYAGTHDVAIAVVTSGRTIPVDEIESVIGPCMATVPLRVKINHSRSVKDLLDNIHSLNRQILDHSGVSFRDIQRSVGFDQELTLCDVLFVWQESLESHHNEDAAFNLVASSDQLEFKLTMEVEPRGHDVFGKATYFNSSLSKTQIQFLFKQLDELVIHFLRTTNCLIEDIPIAMTPEVGSILNPNPELETFEDGLVELIDRVSLDHPDRNAVLFVDSAMATKTRYQILTYRELNERANQISHLLRDRVRDEDELVCICMEKSIDLYVAILGVLKSGRGYLPITPQTPVERIRGILKESGIAFCLSHGETSRDLGLDANIVVTNIEEVDFSELSVNTVPARRDGQLAYAMFTSGSTGAPKGVLVTEQNLLSNLKVLAEIYPTCENPRLLQACSQAFDVSAFEIFYAWFSGMCLCSMSNDVLFQDLEHAIRELEITHLSLTPTVAALIHPDNVPTVRFLVTAGEAVTEHVMKLWAGRGLFQGYGPSETTNICTVNPDFQHMNLIHDVGFPLRNTSAFVLEPSSQNIVLRGGLGELCFGGDQVFRGYLNRDDLTAEKVIIHEAYGKIYRSGDLGRILPSGAIECIGRIDDQLKIRGQRVELGEINRTLLKDENILDCVTLVIGIESTNADTLVSFYVPSGCETTDILIRETDDATRALIQRAFNLLESTLPDYMIPLHLLPISAIPQTSQGKVDKRRLITAFRELGREYLETVTRSSDDFKGDDNWTTAEWQIREAVAAVMKVPVSQLRKHASFFGLGLDSISAISVSRLLRENGFSITVSMILKNPSISRLVRSLSADSDQELSKLPTVFTKEELEQVTQKLGEEGMRIVKVLPCTPLQEAMLSASQAHGPNAYCNLMLFRITGDASRLHEAWDMVRRRHEIFQTAFFHTENMAFPVAQVVLQGPPKIWNSEPEEYRVTDSEALLDLLVKDANDQIARLLQENRPPYNLRMLRFEDDTYIQFACHHTLYDGYAIQRLILEVEAQYNKKAFEEPPSPDDFLKIVASTRNEIATTFWVIKLQSLKPILLRARIGASRGIWKHYLDLPLSVMEAACQTSSTSLLSLVQAALAKSLAYLLQSNDVCFGNVVSGRTFPVDGLDRLVFPTFNTIPVRANLTRTRSNIELLTTLQEWNAASQDFQLVPLRLIQGHLGFGRSGLFSALLLLQPGLYELDPEIWELKADVGNMDVSLSKLYMISPQLTN
jgi:amino acid adenylation domain-containing protein